MLECMCCFVFLFHMVLHEMNAALRLLCVTFHTFKLSGFRPEMTDGARFFTLNSFVNTFQNWPTMSYCLVSSVNTSLIGPFE